MSSAGRTWPIRRGLLVIRDVGSFHALCQDRRRGSRFFKGTGPALQMIFEFLAKLLDDRDRGHGGGVTQGAERTAQHVLRKILDVVDIFLHSAAGMKASQRLLQPIGPFAAGNAPSAALMLIELHDAKGE